MTTLSQKQLRQIFGKAGQEQIPGKGNDRDITEMTKDPFVAISERDLRSIIPELADPRENMSAYHEKVRQIFGGWARHGGMLRSLGYAPSQYRVELDLNKLKQAIK